MEALYKLYSNDYFGIGLFIVVTILAFSFLIILFFGKKDEKNKNINEIEENDNVNSNNNSESLSSMSLEQDNLTNMEDNTIINTDLEDTTNIKEEDNVISEVKEINPFDGSGVILESGATEPVKKEIPNLITESENLNNEELPEVSENSPVIEEEKIPDIFSAENIVNTDEDMVKPKKVFSNQFSSVYVNNKDESPTEQNNQDNEEEMKPVKPAFELPKELDLPKLNKAATSSDSIIKTVEDSSSDINNIMNSLEDESFNIEEKE